MPRGSAAQVRSIEPDENRALVYVCECGKKWSGPPKAVAEGDAKRWKCNCGRSLAMRERVIFQG